MARHSLPPYEVDSIHYTPHPTVSGMVRARARYRREQDGPLLDVYGTGKTEAAARRDLRANLAKKQGQHHGGSAQISGRTTVEQVAKVWLDEKRAQRPRLASRTVEEYGKWVGAYVNGTTYGRLAIASAAKPARGEAHLRDVANGTHKPSSRGGGEGAMRSARKVLHGIMDTALHHEAIPHRVRFRLQGRTVETDRRRIDTDRAFTREELSRVQAVADASSADVGDLTAFLSALGPRIAEALHGVWWADVDLTTGEVKIRGTKSKNAVRAVLMPQWLTDRLTARARTYGTKGLVFGVTRYSSKLGKPRDLSNVLDTMRGVLDSAGCEWAGTHTFRRTVATMLDDAGVGTGAIATVLGQDPVTTSSYIKTSRIGDAAAVALDTAF
jgi:integrase